MKGQKSLPGTEREKKVFQFAAGSKPDFHLLLSSSVNQAPEEHSLCMLETENCTESSCFVGRCFIARINFPSLNLLSYPACKDPRYK